MYHKVLLAIDYEDEDDGKRALEEGIRVLDEGGELHLVTVYNPDSASFFPHVTEDTTAERKQQLQEKLSLLARKYQPGNAERVAKNVHVLTGTPGEMLTALAGNIAADLLVLVCKGAGSRWWPLRRATVEYVAINAPCAVLILPAPVETPGEAVKGR